MNIGKVFLVGSGPGDPELISVKGLNCIKNADVILHDRLIDTSLLENVKESSEIINVGKSPGDSLLIQDRINELMREKALLGKYVVRLKGGDPFIFGRGSEEAQFLKKHGLKFEIVPGISSIYSVAAYAGIPLTHRGTSSSFTVLTGTEVLNSPEKLIGFRNILPYGDTLIVLMGLKNIENIVDVFINKGLDKNTPVALIGSGTTSRQNIIVGDLYNIIDKLNSVNISTPVVAIFGEVVKLRKEIKWFDNKPLFGKNILITRSKNQSSAIEKLLRSEGANPIIFPTIEIKPINKYKNLDKYLLNSKSFDWILFTSQNAVNPFFDRMFELGIDLRYLSSVKIGAIGSITSDTLKYYGIVPDVVGVNNNSSDFIDEFEDINFRGLKILLPTGNKSKNYLYNSLIDKGANPTNLEIYKTVEPGYSKSDLYKIFDNGIDICTFTSPSTVENLVKFIDGDLNLLSKSTIACIGSVTASAAEGIGLRVEIISKEYTIEGLLGAIENYYIQDL